MQRKCLLCGTHGECVETKNGRAVCEDGPGCVERARSFKWWRAVPWVKKPKEENT